MTHKQLRRLFIRLRLSRWLAPALCALPYLGSIIWLLGRGQVWIAGVMLSPALVLGLLIGLTWTLARIEFRGSLRG